MNGFPKQFYTGGDVRVWHRHAGALIRRLLPVCGAALLAACATISAENFQVVSGGATDAHIVPISALSGKSGPQIRNHVTSYFPASKLPTTRTLGVGRVYYIVPVCNGGPAWNKAYEHTVASAETITVGC